MIKNAPPLLIIGVIVIAVGLATHRSLAWVGVGLAIGGLVGYWLRRRERRERR